MIGLAPDAKILVIKTHAIGDLLLATPALRDLRAAYPRARISLLTGSWSEPVVRHNPHLDEVIVFEDRTLLDPRPLKALWLLLRLRRRRFDGVMVLHPSPALHLFAWLTGARHRFGLIRNGRSFRLTAGVTEDLGPDTYYPVNHQRVTALTGAVPGEPVLELHHGPHDAQAVTDMLLQQGIKTGEPYLLMAPGGGRNSKDDVSAKRWPPERFAETARALQVRHPRLRIVITGGAGDREETARVAAAIPGAADLTGHTTLTQLAALTRGATAVVCNDSALLHIAVACRRPVFVPFGPTLRDRFVPPELRALSAQSDLPCSPCYVGGDFPGCSIGHACLRDMPASRLIPLVDGAIG